MLHLLSYGIKVKTQKHTLPVFVAIYTDDRHNAKKFVNKIIKGLMERAI